MAEVALITGASAGLGAEFAELFAADKVDVVLLARRKERLEALSEKLRSLHGVQAHVLPSDLSSPGEAPRVAAWVAERNLSVRFLVNNAGFGARGIFAEIDVSRQLSMIDVNVRSLVELTHVFLRPMLAERRGRILNVGSVAGFQPGPYMTLYYATKAFVNSFSEALAHELRGSGVTVTVSCPGPTATEFGLVARGSEKREPRLFRLPSASARLVAEQAYRAMLNGKPVVIHQPQNKAVVQLQRVLPRAWVRSIAARLNSPSPS